VISCIHLEEQTKDILKLKSVSKYNQGGGGGGWGIFPEIWISMLKIYLKCNNYNKAFCDWLAISYYVSGEKGGLGVIPQKSFTFLKL
jgi:hypothetical protein